MDNHQSQALKPNIFTDFHSLESVTDKQAAKKGIDPDEGALAYLSRTKGWRVLKAYIESLQKDLDNLVTASMAQGLSREAIGDRAILSSLTKEALDKIINKIQDAREAVE